jgi:aerobic-type carbon monoxide dehydrogenase small subunit (CoxS/CutS family)
MSNVTLRVNGASHTVDVDPATRLLYVLRNDLGLRGPRFGCGLGQCGACTVIIDGVATRSCVTRVSNVTGEVTTLEGLSRDGALDPLQQAWIDEQVPQCGFCQNGQIMTARALLDRNPIPTDAEIRQAMDQALCRCMTYYRVQAAIKRVARGQQGVAVGEVTDRTTDRAADALMGAAHAPGRPSRFTAPARPAADTEEVAP